MGSRRISILLSVALCTGLCGLGVFGGALASSDVAAASPTWNTTALPFTTPGPIQGTFVAVSCMTAISCVAVGEAYLGTTHGTDFEPFVANLSSGSWVQGLLPLPTGATSASLAGVSCSTTECVAVGTDTASQSHGLIE